MAQAHKHDTDSAADAASALADQPAKPRRARAPKVHVGSSSSLHDRDADRASMKQVRITFVFLAFVAVVYVGYLFVTGQVDDFFRALVGVDLSWIARGVACFLCYYVFGVLAYAVLAATDHDSPVGFRDLMSVEASGVFFMRLTPGGAGVIPSQIYRLTRAGLPLADASALQFVRFTLYEAGEGIFAGIMLLLCGGYFLNTFADVTILGLDVTWIGLFMFGYKFVQVGGVLLLCLLPGPIQRIGGVALRAGRALHVLNEGRYERFRTVLETQVGTFSSAFRAAAKHRRALIAAEVITLVQLGCMYALPYFVLRAFGLEANFLVCLASGSMVELLVNAIPLPGGAGGAEVGFTYLFQGMFGWHLSAGLVIWRSVEYLLPVIIAAPCMGMRSGSKESIYRRWTRRMRNIWRFFGGTSGELERPAGIEYRPKKWRTSK